MICQQFWTLVRDYAKNQIKTEKPKCSDRKCPNCHTWMSEFGDEYDIVPYTHNKTFEIMTCIRCGHYSLWNVSDTIPRLTGV